MKNLENTSNGESAVSLYDERGAEDFRRATLHPDAKFILPKFSADDVYNKYIDVIKSKRARKVFSEEYLAIEAINVDNIELVYAENIDAVANADVTHDYSYTYQGYENGDTRFSYVGRAFDSDKYSGHGTGWSCHSLNYAVHNYGTSIGGLPACSGRDLPDKKVRLFRAAEYEATGRAASEAYKDSKVDTYLVGTKVDRYEKVSTKYSSSVSKSVFFPVWIITTHKGNKVYHSFYNGLADIYEIDGDSRKNKVKNKLHHVFAKLGYAFMTIASLFAFALVTALFLVPDVYPLLVTMYNEFGAAPDFYGVLGHVFSCILYIALAIILLAIAIVVIGAPIFISCVCSESIYRPFDCKLSCARVTNSFASIVVTGLKMLLQLLLIAVILAVLFFLVILWEVVVEWVPTLSALLFGAVT